MQEVHTLLPVGSIIHDRYEVEELLGKGGFGAVYLVRDLRVKGNRFALKEVIDPRKQDRVHFLFEGELLKKLDFPSLPRVYRVFEEEAQQRVYLLMDYIEGSNLEQVRQRQPGKRFSLPAVLRLLAPVIEAVSYLHNQQPPIMHRDIKPANIIIPLAEGNPVLVDFGIAKEYEQDATTTAVRRLSPNYGAPEQYTRGTNPRTDIYGMAATCYTLLTGSVPVDAFYRLTTLGNQGTDPLDPIRHLAPDIPVPVAEVIERGMAIAPNDRFPTMQAFWNALESAAFASTSPGPMTPPPIPALPMTPVPQSLAATSQTQTDPIVNIYQRGQQGQQRQQPSRKRRLLPALFALIALAALLGGLFLGTSVLRTHHPFPGSGVSGTGQTGVAHHASTPQPSRPTQGTQPSQGATATAPSKPSPTTQPHGSPTSPAPSYPAVQGTYAGTIHNTPGNINGDMSLSAMQQQGSNISGTFALSNGLYGQAHLTGTVSTNNTLRFLVTPYTQYPPLLFYGQVNADGSLSGNYCSVQNNQCDEAAGGYGTWRVVPQAYGS